MKRKFTLLVGLTILGIGATAKGNGGVYRNAADFKSGKIAYEIDCSKKKSKIHLHDFFGNTQGFSIVNHGRKLTLSKSEIFGFRDCNNNTYRFYNNSTYRLVEAGNVYIYTQERNVVQTKGFKVVLDYFFSTGADGAIMQLNNQNLINAYQANEKFIDRLESYNGDVAAYDGIHKMFTVNYLYSRSQK